MTRAAQAPWLKQPGEGQKSYEYFEAYRDQAIPRSIQRLAERLGRQYSYLRKISAARSWQERVRAWDNERQKSHDTVVLSEVERVSRDQLKAWSTARVLGSVALVRALQHAQTHKDLPVDVRDALALLKEATAAERLILGEATSREAVISLDKIEEMPLERAELLLELIQEAGGQ